MATAEPPQALPATLGARIRHYRQLRGLSQAEAARRAKISQPAWSNLEADAFDAKLSTLRRVAATLRVRVGRLTD